MKLKEVIGQYGVNLMKGILPMPISMIVDTINECQSADELKLEFDRLKRHAEEYAEGIQNSLPSIPMSVEVEYASVVVLYYLVEPQNINILMDKEQIEKQIETILEEQKESVDEYEVCSDYIILKSQEPISKSDWQCGSIETFKRILDKEFDIKIKSILYV